MEDVILRIAMCVPGFLLAIVCHEWAHARMALHFGDDTALQQGRLTLNPAAHIDVMGTIVFPLIFTMLGGVMFGWAKPVPINARYFKNVRKGVFWVSFAGPLMNIILGFAFALVFGAFMVFVSRDFYLHSPLSAMLDFGVRINFILAVFNLIPFPPLDGSKMVTTFLNYNQMRKYEEIARFSFPFMMILWFSGALSYILWPAEAMGQLSKVMFLKLFILIGG